MIRSWSYSLILIAESLSKPSLWLKVKLLYNESRLNFNQNPNQRYKDRKISQKYESRFSLLIKNILKVNVKNK